MYMGHDTGPCKVNLLIAMFEHSELFGQKYLFTLVPILGSVAMLRTQNST